MVSQHCSLRLRLRRRAKGWLKRSKTYQRHGRSREAALLLLHQCKPRTRQDQPLKLLRMGLKTRSTSQIVVASTRRTDSLVMKHGSDRAQQVFKLT
jgi:hypothetical protein